MATRNLCGCIPPHCTALHWGFTGGIKLRYAGLTVMRADKWDWSILELITDSVWLLVRILKESGLWHPYKLYMQQFSWKGIEVNPILPVAIWKAPKLQPNYVCLLIWRCLDRRAECTASKIQYNDLVDTKPHAETLPFRSQMAQILQMKDNIIEDDKPVHETSLLERDKSCYGWKNLNRCIIIA